MFFHIPKYKTKKKKTKKDRPSNSRPHVLQKDIQDIGTIHNETRTFELEFKSIYFVKIFLKFHHHILTSTTQRLQKDISYLEWI